MESNITLGTKCRDTITGAEGIATAFHAYLDGPSNVDLTRLVKGRQVIEDFPFRRLTRLGVIAFVENRLVEGFDSDIELGAQYKEPLFGRIGVVISVHRYLGEPDLIGFAYADDDGDIHRRYTRAQLLQRVEDDHEGGTDVTGLDH